ncbi:hypothetical protein [Breoghania sp.]|nr:hypothetical protein [Breoghania sp.]MDJ0931128.1 hypothetical protein [Breoghania sp.]
MLATGMIHLIGIGVGLALQRIRGGMFSCVLGGVIALGVCYYLIV